jgi:hypothetical protein
MVNKTPRWVSYVDAITLYMDHVNFELQSMGHDIMHKEREVQDEGIHTQQPCPSYIHQWRKTSLRDGFDVASLFLLVQYFITLPLFIGSVVS